MTKEYDQYKKLINLMVKLNLKYRDLAKKESLGKYNFAMEYATVKCDIGRQVGKTTYIKEQLEKNKNSIVVVNNRQLNSNFKTIKSQAITVNRYSSIKEFDIENLDKIKTVYIDDASWNDKVELIYEIFTQDDIERTFVLLG